MINLQMQAKNALRQEIKRSLKLMSPATRTCQSKTITSNVIKLPEYQNSSKIGVYLSMDEEVATDDLIRNIFQSGKECFIPWYSKETMMLVKLASADELETLPKTKWNIRQPDDPELRENALLTGLDVVLVPGLAFTTCGKRLGRGKGYYDTFLNSLKEENLKKCKTTSFIGLAFREQIVSDIPTAAHDVLLDLVMHP